MAVPELAPLQVKHRLDAGEPLRILDVREPWERAIVSLPGSVNIPMGEIPARWRELDAEAQIVVLCKAGSRSRRVANFDLRAAPLLVTHANHGHIANLDAIAFCKWG